MRSPEELARELPDLPRWVETRGLLLSGRSTVFDEGSDGFVVRGVFPSLICVVGGASPGALRQALAAQGEVEVVAPPQSEARVTEALSDWRREPATIHALPIGRAETFPSPAVEVALLSGNAPPSLAHLPAPLKREIEEALCSSSHVAAAFVEGVPVSFCYSACETETLWDVSIETLEACRGRGLARETAGFLIQHMTVHGKAPVWGSEESNLASRRLAIRLGFEAVDRLVVFKREKG